MEEIVKEVEKRVSIPVYEESIARVLSALLSTTDIWELVSLSEEPLPLVMAILEVLNEMGFVDFSAELSLTEKGRELVERYQISKTERLLCECCGGRGLSIESFKEILRDFISLTSGRPEPKHEFDQAFVTPETVISRVALMLSRGDLKGKDVFVLGDDDLISIALMLTGLPRRIAVLDIDERLISFIEDAASQIGFERIDIFVFDLREPLPDYAKGKFSTFITDPPETPDAIRCFVGRGISSLRGPGCAGYFGLTRIESSLDKWRELQKILLNEFNVVITDVIKDFNEYVNWGYMEHTKAWKLTPLKSHPKRNWYRSYMFRIQTLRNSKGFDEKINISKELYEDEESSTT
ncbi:MAG: N4-bis(aminopropyl)spermidine synthase [Archaeoglobi archaeon]|nr:N4-bis(aminopropyl)spermidine synthase [Archaeoglobi archaeon]